MKTILVIADGARSRARGVQRGLIGAAVILAGLCVRHWRAGSAHIGAAVFAAVVLSSAVAVQLPSSTTAAALYGALVGFVVFSCVNTAAVVFSPRPPQSADAVVDTAFGAGLLAVAAVVIFCAKLYV